MMSRFVRHQVISDEWLVVSSPLKSRKLITNYYQLTTVTTNGVAL